MNPINIRSNHIAIEEIKHYLKTHIDEQKLDIKLELKFSGTTRSPDILIAIIGFGSGIAAALLNGIFGISKSKGDNKIIIRARNGRSIEAPSNISPDRMKLLIAQCKLLEIDDIEITNSHSPNT